MNGTQMELTTVAMSLEDYAASYTGPLSDIWSIQPDNGGYEVTFPNGATAAIRGADTDWAFQFPTDLATSRLWLHSLTYAPYLYWDHGDWATTAAVFASYEAYFTREQSRPDYVPMNSLDHAHAAQLLAVSAVYASLVARGELYPERQEVLVRFVEVVGRSALSEGMIKFNNHGMMLTRALAHVAFVFQGVSDIAADCGLSGVEEFDRIIQAAFDDNGIVNENTPAYQILYMRVVDTMITFLRRTALQPEYVQIWESLMSWAKDSLALQLFSDGKVPPIGDDAGGVSPYPSTLGELYSPSNGLFVRKTETSYVSIISGYRGVVHKHLDDTSLRLQHKNVDLVIDAGLLTYDASDKVGVAIVSQRGHSGLYFPRFDHVRPIDAFLVKPPRQYSWIDRRVDLLGHEEVACGYVVDGAYQAERLYTFLNDSTIFITDSYSAPDEEQAIQRFLFPGNAEIAHRNGSLEVVIEDAKLVLWTEPTSTIRFHLGSGGDMPKGWRAVKFYESEPCWSVEISVAAGRSSIRSAIAFGDADQDVALPVEARSYWS
jgi:hypothetical protein